MTASAHPLRPFLPADAMALRELFAASIEELCQEDYDEDQRAAWASAAEDGDAFLKRLASALTLVVHVEGEHLGFASLEDNKTIAMLYVHPLHAGEGIGTTLCDALEKLAAARGAASVSVDASDTAQIFFESRGYAPVRRNSVPVGDQWLSNTTMTKPLKPASAKATP